MSLTKFVSKYSAEEIEAMLDKVKLDMQVINFTQQEIAGLLTKIQGIKSSDLTNDLGFITNTVNDLANYYTKSQTYTKTEVDALVSNITAASFELVNTLPTQDISTTAIYLVPNSSGQTNNTYDEYINLDGTSNGWEIIGSTQIDLSALNNKYDTSDQAETDLSDADYVPFYDTSATSKRKTLWSNIKDKLRTYFDTLYHKKITVDTLADLVDSSNYQSTYLGMTVFVTSELKKYVLIGSDVTVASNWQPQGSGTADSPIIMTRSAYLQLSTAQKNDNKVRYIPDWPSSSGSSGGETGGGHTIEDPEGTALTQRDVLQFGGDLEVSDDDENEKTVVVPHELTVAELAEIVSPLPSVPVNMPILFDETGTERVVGWYRLANGTKKPVYEKSFYSSETVSSGTNIPHGVANIDSAWITSFYIRDVNNRYYLLDQFASSNGKVLVDSTNIGIVFANDRWTASNGYRITLRYTKTTDTPT